MSKYRDRAVGFKEGHEAAKRPVGVLDEHLIFLDKLRESGVTNMCGASPYLRRQFRLLSENQASMILGYWMKSFGDPKR